MPRYLLVVDDSATIRDAVRYALAGEDWIVVTAADTAEALETVRESTVDAVICDASLAPEDGYEACRALRSAMGDEPVPIVLMGAKVSENLAASAGATSILPKPFESQELLEALQAGVEQSSFDLEAEDFAPLEEGEEVETLAPTPVAGPSLPDEEIEIIDFSDEEEGEELELLQDLEPLTPAPAGAAGEAAMSAGDWQADDLLRPLDLDDLGVPEEPAAPEAEPPPRGPVEFGMADLGGTEEEPAVFDVQGLGEPAGETAELDLADVDLDLEGGLGGATAGPEASSGEPAPREPAAPPDSAAAEELLGDIDLEGWPEEAAASQEAEGPPAPEVAAPEGEDQVEEWLEVKGPAEAEVLGEAHAEPAETAAETEAWDLQLAEESPAASAAEEPLVLTETAPAEAVQAWAEPPPAPAEPEAAEPPLASADLTAPVARAAEQAVRQALAESLSADALGPVIEAVVERVVWEVVPPLAERLIREAIERLQGQPAAE